MRLEFHGNSTAGHVGSERTRKAVMTQLWWPRRENEVDKYVADSDFGIIHA